MLVLSDFLADWHISHSTRIPCSLQSQVFVEYKNWLLSLYLSKHNGGTYATAKEQLPMAVYAINYESLDEQGFSAPQQQWVKANPCYQLWWKDLVSNIWKPGHIKLWGQDHAWVTIDHGEDFWILAQRLKPLVTKCQRFDRRRISGGPLQENAHYHCQGWKHTLHTQ